MNRGKTILRVVVGVISTLLAAPSAVGASWVVYDGLRGRNYSDVGVAMFEHQAIAQAAGLGVLLTLTASSLVLIHDLVRSRIITIFGVIWTVPWIALYLLGTAIGF